MELFEAETKVLEFLLKTLEDESVELNDKLYATRILLKHVHSFKAVAMREENRSTMMARLIEVLERLSNTLMATPKSIN